MSAEERAMAPVIAWFRDDLRIADNPALDAAKASGRPLLCLFVLEEGTGRRALGAAARWWLDKSLAALDEDLKPLGGRLVLRRGDPRLILPEIATRAGATGLYFNRRYDHEGSTIDDAVTVELRRQGVAVSDHAAWLLFEPGAIQTKTGGPFRVFTPFWKAHRPHLAPEAQLRRRPETMALFKGTVAFEALASFDLHPTRPDWSTGLAESWTPGEAGAKARLAAFLNGGLSRYAAERDFPAVAASSRLSPHLRFGEIAVARVVHEVMKAEAADAVHAEAAEKFLAEIGWREFAWHLLSVFPDLATRNVQAGFSRFPWREDPVAFSAWTAGRTGYPIVDAGMRELWQTGFMHNRVRMIAASFLTKHLLIHWKQGEEWFWDTLVDADFASNPFGWQWVAGTGADAAPYFRVFNPTAQGEKFDPEGIYVRRFVPETADLPNRQLHRPWEAPPLVRPAPSLYPAPIVDHDMARKRALDAFARCR
ncbi:deoxyribodipyrimidine photo-lyase [Pleomorphomonas sp. NRK KF1]|uniref:cryptochrome/photolyase family protein n=1 Tax=Pleomorphomonas sp. NRK KF1 TaxID=2943000 RepID=UPI0020446F68|nr:deoxyribodipyrimidine photo-lyase [Pleomorphomonas sp. NRK KF1]MCM5552701.1 DNA photolyase family protein [Pleomorphomonas sp. NRK KF1]